MVHSRTLSGSRFFWKKIRKYIQVCLGVHGKCTWHLSSWNAQKGEHPVKWEGVSKWFEAVHGNKGEFFCVWINTKFIFRNDYSRKAFTSILVSILAHLKFHEINIKDSHLLSLATLWPPPPWSSPRDWSLCCTLRGIRAQRTCSQMRQLQSERIGLK